MDARAILGHHAPDGPRCGGCPARCPGGCPGPGPGPGTFGANAIQRPRLERPPRRIGNMSARPSARRVDSLPAIQHGVERRARSRPRGARGVGGGAFLPVFAHALGGKGQHIGGNKFFLHGMNRELTAPHLLRNLLLGFVRPLAERNLDGLLDVAAFKTLCGKGQLFTTEKFILYRLGVQPLGLRFCPCPCPSPRPLWRRVRPGHVRRRSARHRGSGHPAGGIFRAPIQGGASAG